MEQHTLGERGREGCTGVMPGVPKKDSPKSLPAQHSRSPCSQYPPRLTGKRFLEQSYTVLCLVTSGEALERGDGYHFLSEHPSPEPVGRDTSLGWQAAQALLATTVAPGRTAGACRRAAWAARSSSLAGVSQVLVPNCAVPPLPSSAEGKGRNPELKTSIC